jgi:twitching motility protein PilT
MPALLDFLRTAVEHGASDVHLKLDRPPTFRFESKLVESESPPLTEPDLFAIADDLIPAHLKERFKRDNEVDFALHEDDIGRFRVNVFMSQGVPTVALRHVKTKVPTFEELNLPIVLKTLAMAPRGIILTAGATSCGKSSTLAAMIRHINAHRRVRIITIEDPIEYLFTDEKSLISQREVELDTHGFKPALKHVLRQDPDVIMVGEMRDPESFMAALSSSETGHLVLSTLHSDTASNAINRILDFFPADERDNIRMAIAANLREGA